MLTPAEWTVIWLSLRVAAVAVAATAPFGLALAYWLARRRGTTPFVVDNLIQLPLVLPPVVTGWLLLVAFGPEGPIGRLWAEVFGVQIAFTWIGAALAAGVVAFPLMVQTMRVAFAQVDPEWEEAGYVYGGGRWDVFRRVTLPLAARGMAAGLVLAFARALGEFGATIVIAGNIPGRTQTLPLAIFTRINQLGGEAGALRLILLAVALSLLSLFLHALLTRHLHRW